MKKITLITLILISLGGFSFAHTETDTGLVKKAALNYIEGFYEGNTDKLSSCLVPTLHKFGFWKKRGSDTYENAGFMTFKGAITFAKNVRDKKTFPKPDAPKGVEVLDVLDKIAITKITAWWGVDYALLAKNDGKWMIRQILWEGPAKTASPTDADKQGAKNAGLGYIEGFYQGDDSKLTSSLKPTLFKFGYGINKKTGKYSKGSRMTFKQAIDYAKWVKEKNRFAKTDAPKKVEVLDVINHIAAIKVTAWWGIDYMLLSKNDDKWMVEQVLWAAVPKK